MKEITTTNLAEFGYREIVMASELLNAWVQDGLPEDFNTDGVHLMMNRESGNVFLTNSDYQVAMMADKELLSFYSCHECGIEGFAQEIEWNAESNCCADCVCVDAKEPE